MNESFFKTSLFYNLCEHNLHMYHSNAFVQLDSNGYNEERRDRLATWNQQP